MSNTINKGLHHTQLYGLLQGFIIENKLFDPKKVKANREKYVKQFEKFVEPKMSRESNDILIEGKLHESCTELINKLANGQVSFQQNIESIDEVGPFIRSGRGFTPGGVDQIASAANDLGFRKYKNEESFNWCHLSENRLTKLSQDHANEMFGKLLKPLTDSCEDTKGLDAKYTQLLGKNVLLSSNLKAISEFHHSKGDTGYLYFENIIVEVTKDKIKIIKWKDINAPVWAERIICHDLKSRRKKGKSVFRDFVRNLQNEKFHTETYFKSVLGYLLHDFRRGNDDQMVVIIGNQEVKKGDNKGGAGKSLLAQSFQHIVRQTFVAGESLDLKGNRFTWHDVKPSTQQIFIDELQQGSLKTLKSIMSTAMVVKPFQEPPFVIRKENLPKFVATMAEIPDFTDEGVGRRLIPLVLSDYYYHKVKAGDRNAVQTTHGKPFFRDEFNQNDWNFFMWFMIDCLRCYLKNDFNTKSVFDSLRPRLARQEFEDPLFVAAVKKKIDLYNGFLLSDLWEFKRENQTDSSFSKTVKEVAKTFGFTMKVKSERVEVNRITGRLEKVRGCKPQRVHFFVKDE